MKNTVFTIFSFATFILVLSFKKCQGPVHARFIVFVVPLNLFLPSVSPTYPPFFQEDSESGLWHSKEQHQPSDRISLRPGSAKRTYTTNRGGGASSENCRRIFVPFPWEAEGTAGGCRKFICGRPRLHHPRFLSLLAPSQGLCVFLIHLVLVFFFLLSPREHKHREAGRELGLRARGAWSASNGRVVGSCPDMFDVLLITNFFCINIRILFKLTIELFFFFWR